MNHSTRHLACCALLSMGAAHAVSLGNAGYTQNFDSMGSSGTAAPLDWAVLNGPAGTSNSTWTSSIPGTGVAALVLVTAPLTASSAPTATNVNGYNAAASAGTPVDRVLATSPTSVSGSALQLSLSNNTGAALPGLAIGFDTVRFTAVTTANELPGYWLFYSLDGATWSNVAALNASTATVPNTVGISNTSGSFAFSTPVAAGATFSLRWVDDNAVQTSPDQIIGLNNVSISAVPEPETVALWLAGLGVLLRLSSNRARD